MKKIKDVYDYFKSKDNIQQEQSDDNWTCPDCGTENEQDYCEICGLKYLERRV